MTKLNFAISNIQMIKKIIFALPIYLAFTSFVLPKNQLKVTTTSSKTFAKKSTSEKKLSNAEVAHQIFSEIDFEGSEILDEKVFEIAYKGFNQLKMAEKLPESSEILTIADFSKSSNRKRLWVIDLGNKKILFNVLVAHGMGTGEEYALHFSNKNNSHQSSLGFYITENTYTGNNGYSLKLEGMDAGFNDAALQRAIVMHGADYVSADFANAHKRIGRSWGCPALSREMSKPVINTIKGQNCLFIYFPDQVYLNSSKWLQS